MEDVVYSYLASSKAKYGLTLATAVLAGACIKYYQSGPDNRIPCFDPYRRAYLEDRFKDDGVIVTLWSHSWLTRINRTGEVILKVGRSTRILHFSSTRKRAIRI